MSRATRALVHVQHLLGVGHLRRAITLARGLADAGVETIVASGGMPVPNLALRGIDFVQLPPVRAQDATFKTLVDERGDPVDDAWRARRRDALLALFQRLDPSILAIELFPFGRRLLRFELLPLLDAARARRDRPVVACSLRDILHPPAPERIEGIVETVARDIDLVLVHGDPALIPLDLSFSAIDRIRGKLRYTGYLVDPPGKADPGRAPEVIVSSGGGAVGEPLLRAALAARPVTRWRGRPWRFLVGHNLAEERFRALMAEAPAGVTIERARQDFTALLPQALCSVSQAGYNTAIEVLAARVPAVFVPFADAGEVEQTLRCKALAERGLCRFVTPEALSTASLAAAIDAAEPTPAGFAVDLDGARKSAKLLLLAVAEKAKLAAIPPLAREP
ncbi:MAG: glycosyl transferase family 28 [Alphaproteobacteria bacterium]|nr:glycosyl transferase family 28 [Alphaproteobacteria bacterium]